MLTRDEAKKIAPLAARYPAGNGESYFIGEFANSCGEAEVLLKEDSSLLTKG